MRSMTVRNVAVVVGVGPGLGSAVAQRFAREGYGVALVARGQDKLDPVKAAVESEGGRAASFPADATDPGAVASTFGAIRKELGDPEVLVYNAGAFVMGAVAEITPEQFERAWRGNCFGGFLCAREVVPAMAAAGRGTILFTGATASLRGSARFAGLAVGKFGLRALAQSMARELGPRGVHVAHVIIDGQIATPRQLAMQPDRPRESFLDPDAIAESYWHLHRQDRTSWTQELDLRPALEKF
jgi:NAD(P)-dependent dehydrogenase (short-subunit alcohol dehydrogenase family)